MPDFRAYVRENLPKLDVYGPAEAEVVEELALEFQENYERALRNGLSPEDAWNEVRGRAKPWDELARELRIVLRERFTTEMEFSRATAFSRYIADLHQDLRYTFRQLRTNPGFSLIVLLTLAFGIGANAAIFSVVDAVVLRPLTYRDPGGLVVIDEQVRSGSRLPVNASHFNEWRRSSRSVQAMALIGGIYLNLTGSGEPERVSAARVSPALFPMLGVQPALGRMFSEEEDQPGRDHVVMISDTLWKRRFAADPEIVRKTITLNGDSYEVVGVLPANFHFPHLSHLYAMNIAAERPELWKPFALQPQEMSPVGDHNYACIARLARGVSMSAARSELQTVMSGMQTPASSMQLEPSIRPLQEQMAGRSSAGLKLLLAAVGVVLLVGCVNITNLLLTRMSGRRREIAIRAAIGASRRRLIRQLLLESLTLSALGGLCGLLVAQSAIRFILSVAPTDLPRLDEVGLNYRVFLFALIVSVLTGLLVGLLPALRFANADLHRSMTSASRSATANRASGTLRSFLISCEVGMTALCLVTGGLLVRSFFNLLSVDRGFETTRIVTVDVTFSAARYPTVEKKAELITAAIEHLETLPGVTAAGITNKLPLSGEGSNNSIIPEDTATPERPVADIRTVNRDFLYTMGIPLYHGRTFDEHDRSKSVAVISKATAEHLWPHESAIGKRFRLGAETRPPVEVIGIAGDVHGAGLDRKPEFTLYVPYWQGSFNPKGVSFIVRTDLEPSALSHEIRAALYDVDPELPLSAFRTMEDVLAESVAQRRFQMNLVLSFAFAALVLASLGVYGVMSYSVARRTGEFGIRIALGATPRVVLRGVIFNALTPVAVGLLMAFPAAMAAASWLRSLLYGVAGNDPAILLASGVVLTVMAVFAAYIPARRASLVDPVVSLRQE
jgi:predicted permease